MKGKDKEKTLFFGRFVVFSYSVHERIIKSRVRKLRTALKAEDIDALVVTSTANVTYLTGFSGDDSWLLLTRHRNYLITDSRYVEQAGKETHLCRIFQRDGRISTAITKILTNCNTVRRVGIESCSTIAQRKALSRAVKGRLKNTEGIIEKIRQIKDKGEIALIRTTARLAQQAFDMTQYPVGVPSAE